MKIFKPYECKSTPRADMFLPDFLKLAAILLCLLAVAFLVVAFALQIWWAIAGFAIFGGLGLAAWLCWKNQTIRIVGEDSFEYTTFLGKTTVYRFSDIKELRENADSWTLVLSNGKVHIEAMVCMSETLYNKIVAAFPEESRGRPSA